MMKVNEPQHVSQAMTNEEIQNRQPLVEEVPKVEVGQGEADRDEVEVEASKILYVKQFLMEKGAGKTYGEAQIPFESIMETPLCWI